MFVMSSWYSDFWSRSKMASVLMMMLLFAAMIFLNFSPVWAIESSFVQTNDLKKSLWKCRTLKSDQKRLMCFDQIVFDITASTSGKDKATISDFGSGDLARQRRKNTENNLPLAQDENDPQDLTTTIITGDKTKSGLYAFKLENGQIWRQIRSDRVKGYVPKLAGKSVTIRKGTLGSYFLKLEGRRSAIRVERIQ